MAPYLRQATAQHSAYCTKREQVISGVCATSDVGGSDRSKQGVPKRRKKIRPPPPAPPTTHTQTLALLYCFTDILCRFLLHELGATSTCSGPS